VAVGNAVATGWLGLAEGGGVLPGLREAVGVDVGGSGGVGQFASAGLNVVPTVLEGDGVAVALGDAETPTDGDAPLDKAGVVTYGVYEGHAARVGVGGACAPATTSEIATAIAPMTTVMTNVTAPHSRHSALMSGRAPARPARHP
jgi:hypothetical protein